MINLAFFVRKTHAYYYLFSPFKVSLQDLRWNKNAIKQIFH